jgi:apolipoprotein N-acyltransferase
VLNWILALVSAALLVLTFPRFHIVWFAPVALTPLLIALAREARPLRRFLLGWVSGVFYWFGVCYWIQFVLAFHGGVGNLVGWALFLLFAVAKALHMGAFALLAGILIRRWWAVPAVAAAWVAVEVTHGSLGFAWMALGNAGIDMGIPLRLAPVTGVYGLSFVFMMMATALALAALGRPRRQLLWLALLPLLMLLPALPAPESGHDTALLVQPNISETEDWTSESVDRMQREQVALTARGALTGTETPPSIVVWPEVPAPLYYYEDTRFRNYVDTLARTIHAYLLIGIVAHRSDGAPLNSAAMTK